MILQEMHSASSNQLAASLHSETPSGELWKLLAPPWHCFSAALLNPYHRIALTASLIINGLIINHTILTLQSSVLVLKCP